MRTEVIIPIKNLSTAKQRLAGILTARQRSNLVLAMLEDLLGQFSQIDNARVWVIASNQCVFNMAEAFGVHYIDEGQSRGYNAAAAFAMQRIALAIQKPVFPVVILPGDLPLAAADELSALIMPATNEPACIALAPDTMHRGTNGLYLSRSDLIQPAFGKDSYQQHRYLAQCKSIRTNTINTPGLAHDLDIPDDLAQLALVSRQGATHEFLHTLDPTCLQRNEYNNRGVV